MDEFELEPSELSGALISMEFGPGGRIQQLWVAESVAPEGTQEFQFVCPPLEMGEELTEDYFPGTVLLGARTDPDEPWILSRNAEANRVTGPDVPPGSMTYEYEFGFLEELSATGRFYEIQGPLPLIAWDLKIVNRSRRSVEVGELGFPLALNNVYEGFPRTDQGTRDLFHDRVYVHKFIGGGASYIHAQRMNGRPPGLLIFPGEDTKWEFYNHAPSSLNTPYRWEGIPVVYVLSRAAIEREGWPEWFNGHSSVVLEPGDSRTYHMRFAPTDRFEPDVVAATLVAAGRPAIGLFPAAVTPMEVPLLVEVAGSTPARFATDVEAELETDADDEGGTCVIRAKAPGPLKLTFEDTAGRECDASVLFTLPLESLIERRADWIVDHQVIKEEGPFKHAIVAGNTADGTPVLDLETFVTPFGIESGVADALFLAEKNTLYPQPKQIRALESYLTGFLEKRILNPGDMAIGSLLPNPHGVAVNTGRANLYATLFCLYDSISRIARTHGGIRSPEVYEHRRDAVWQSMQRNCALEEQTGILLISQLFRVAEESGGDLGSLVAARRSQTWTRRYPFNGDSLWSPAGFEEAFWTARARGDSERMERVLRYAFTGRSLSPCWWWYGSDKRWLESPYAPPHPAMGDKGEMCLGPTTLATSLTYMSLLDRDNEHLDTAKLRKAFGGFLSVWALVREDGAASMGFCPDAASKQFGMSWTTGDVGLGLYQYLRGAASYVMASRQEGLQTFGCHFEAQSEGPDERFVLKPWDGVGRRVVVRHLGLEVVSEEARIRELTFDAGKRNATLTLKNPSDKRIKATVSIKGLWGERFQVDGNELRVQDGYVRACFEIPPHGTHKAQIQTSPQTG